MVKGVHKKIIEVRHPGGDYFEKAVFYLRPGVSQLPPELAEAAAQMIIEELQPPSYRRIWKRLAVTGGALLITAAVAVCAVLLR